MDASSRNCSDHFALQSFDTRWLTDAAQVPVATLAASIPAMTAPVKNAIKLDMSNAP
jgi:hypothetical protein